MGVWFASSFFVNSMDMLAEEFGNLTPEHLAAPIPTVEVRAGYAGSGRGRDAYPGGGAARAFALERGGPRLLRMLRPPPRSSLLSPPRARERPDL